MTEFKKIYEPEYGEVSPEVFISKPEIMDLDNPDIWRVKSTKESILSINWEMQKCNCYETLMEVKQLNYVMKREEADIPVRVYLPDGEGPFPIVVFYHGGAFMMNTFEVYDYVTRYIAKFGHAIVVTLEYRLAPEYKFPIGLEDSYAALEWAVAHAGEWAGDISSVSVCGDSAGGNFAAVVSLLARDRNGPKIQKQILIYPLVIFRPEGRHDSEKRYGTGYFLEYNSQENPMAYYFENLEGMYEPCSSPLLAKDLSMLPSACILLAECDPLLDQGLMYAQRLADHAVDVEYCVYKGMLHGFLNRTYGKTFECLNKICAAIPPVKLVK